MTKLNHITKALEFVEENLLESIQVKDIADASGYSLYHFCRIFASIVQFSPYEYLMRRRLSKAAQKVVDSNEKIIDIAYEYQFSSPEVFTRAFKRILDINPKDARKGYVFDPYKLLPAIRLDDLNYFDSVLGGLQESEIVFDTPMQLTGISTLIGQHEVFKLNLLTDKLNKLSKAIGQDTPSIYGELQWIPQAKIISVFLGSTGWKDVGLTLAERIMPEGSYKMIGHQSSVACANIMRSFKYLLQLNRIGPGNPYRSAYFRMDNSNIEVYFLT